MKWASANALILFAAAAAPAASACMTPEGISFNSDADGKINWDSLSLPWENTPPQFGIFQVGAL